MALEKSPNNTLSINGMAIYGKYHYYFGTPDWVGKDVPLHTDVPLRCS